MTLHWGGGGSVKSVVTSNLELREDLTVELREDAYVEYRESDLTS